MSGEKAVVLSSGGIDSTTAMAIARAEGYDLYSLTFNYGQRHVCELEAARKAAGSRNISSSTSICGRSAARR
jgi:7-cyano-7-deazaguanine synthase